MPEEVRVRILMVSIGSMVEGTRMLCIWKVVE